MQPIQITVGGRYVKHHEAGSESVACPRSDRVVPGLLTDAEHYAEAARAVAPTETLLHEPTRSVAEDQDGTVLGNFLATFIGVLVLFGPFLLVLDWLIAKPLLHGQMNWLVWLPIPFALGVALFDRMENIAMLIAGASVLTAAAVGPAVVKVQQLSAEDSYAADVRQIFAGQPQVLSDDDAIRAGWEMCAGLDAAREAERGTFPADAPHLFVARIVLEQESGYGYTGDEEEQMTRIVTLADQVLC